LKVKTDIITSTITAYVKTFKTDAIIFFGIKHNSHTDWYFPLSESLSWYWKYHYCKWDQRI